MKKFKEYSGLNLSDVNKEQLTRWQQLDIFHKSIETREGKPSFVFMKDRLRPMVCREFTT